jgi:hypothetical protein
MSSQHRVHATGKRVSEVSLTFVAVVVAVVVERFVFSNFQ